ncbi:MAG: hypothetical protein ABI822_06185 [Bryobacteraceae bacterium]
MTARAISITLASILACSLSTAQIAICKPSGTPAEREAKGTLKDINQQALIVADEAEQLSRLAENTQNSADTHISRLETIRAEVNRMAREINRLQDERKVLALWEQQAIEKALPVLNETATKAGKAIAYFDANREMLWAAEYRNNIDDIRKDSEQVAKTVKDYLKYQKVSNEAEQLQHSLGAAGE